MYLDLSDPRLQEAGDVGESVMLSGQMTIGGGSTQVTEEMGESSLYYVCHGKYLHSMLLPDFNEPCE
jgi:hypothetical protein